MNTRDFFHNLKEGRRIEFKGEIPTSSDLAKTIVAFANDAGGDVYIGVDNNHNVIGLPEDELPQLEERLSSIIFDRCYPTILPEISFQTINSKNLIKIKVYKGSMPPYYLKNKGKLEGTYIRVGSTNRVADENIIAELERKRRNLSFDGGIVMDKELSELGKDIKVAIYDDMVEITSPGLLPPSIDYSAMNSRQSDAINKVIAPVFKKLGIIDQCGNGLKMIAEELKQYPNIEFKWHEVGLSFQVQFINKKYKSGGKFGGKSGGKSGGKKLTKKLMFDKILSLISSNTKITVQEISDKTGFNKRQCERLLAELKKNGIIIRNGSPRNGEWKII